MRVVDPSRTLIAQQSWLRRLARAMVRSSAAADDLVQETCVIALCKPPPDGPVRPWLRNVMRKLAWRDVRSDRRRAAREETFHRETSPTSDSDLDRLLDRGAARERLSELVEALPEPFRSTIVQRFVDGLSCAEIARAEEVPDGTVRWRQSRALELLREQLERVPHRRRPRRRRPTHALWLAGGAAPLAAAARRPLLPISLRGVAIGLAAAGLVLAIGAALRQGAVSASSPDADGGRASRPRAIGSSRLAVGGAASRRLAPGGAPPHRSAKPAASPTDGLSPVAGAAPGEREAKRRRLRQLQAEYELALYDCRIQSEGVLRCQKRPFEPAAATGTTCHLLLRSLDALELTRAERARSPHSRAFLEAATVANLALAARLGCSVVADADEPSPASARTQGGPGSDEPSCQSEEGQGGESCVSCSASGQTQRVCAPVECQSRTGADGAACTVCTDANGRSEETCSEPTWDDCDSVVQEFGVVCTTCPGAVQPECLVADCQPTTSDCLECTDPRGRVALDCSIDYGAFDGAGWGISSSDTFSSCYVSWGYPSGTSGSCRYVGPETCSYSESGDLFCLDCTNQNDVWGLCAFIGQTPVPDPLKGRPSALPPPGECTTETDPSGAPRCSTCTRHDLTAIKSCRLPAAVSCEPVASGGPLELCLGCSLVGGGSAAICDAGGQ